MDELIQQYNLSYLVKLHKSIKAKIVIINEKINTKREVVKLLEHQREIEKEHQIQLLKQEQKQRKIEYEHQDNYNQFKCLGDSGANVHIANKELQDLLVAEGYKFFSREKSKKYSNSWERQ